MCLCVSTLCENDVSDWTFEHAAFLHAFFNGKVYEGPPRLSVTRADLCYPTKPTLISRLLPLPSSKVSMTTGTPSGMAMRSAPEPSKQACLAGGEDLAAFDLSRSYQRGERSEGLREQDCAGL